MHFHSEAFDVTDYHAAVELFFERGWTDRVKNQRDELALEGMPAYLIKKRPRT